MITLLRRFRRSLIESGSVRKYMLYAIGEILLVIIGILLALAINDWRKATVDRENELFTLESLKTEFEDTRRLITKYIEENNNIISTNQSLIDYSPTQGSVFDNATFDSLLYNSLWNSSLFLNQGILSEIIFSGRLSSISDQNLRVLLSSWGGTVEDTKASDRLGLDYMIKKNSDYFDRKIPWGKLSAYDRLGFTVGNVDEQNYDRLQLSSELEFKNVIYNQIWNAQNKNLSARTLLELNVDILDQIEKAINYYK